jgi:hypothetical protein
MHQDVGEKEQMTGRKDEWETRRTKETIKCSMLVVFCYSHLGEECSEVILRRDLTRGH